MNRNFAKPREDMTPEFAPDTLTIGGRKIYNPKAVHYRIAGYLPLEDSVMPTPPEGKHWERNGKIYSHESGYAWDYALVDNPPTPPRRWTRLSIKTALATAGMLDAARQFLGATEIATGYTAWEALTDCDYIEEGYPDDVHWDEILEGATIALGKTREEIDAFLANIPTED